MKIYNNTKELFEAIKKGKIKKGETVRLDERDQFNISDGNIKTLELIPLMMRSDEFREKLRILAFQFMQIKRRRRRWD